MALVCLHLRLKHVSLDDLVASRTRARRNRPRRPSPTDPTLPHPPLCRHRRRIYGDWAEVAAMAACSESSVEGDVTRPASCKGDST